MTTATPTLSEIKHKVYALLRCALYK